MHHVTTHSVPANRSAIECPACGDYTHLCACSPAEREEAVQAIADLPEFEEPINVAAELGIDSSYADYNLIY